MANAFSHPILVHPNQPDRVLEKVAPEAAPSEAWLQDLLFKHPRALPVDEIDDAFTGLIPICRELNTPAGPIDVVYATPSGRIALLEAKMWRNPEARRKVIAQILDYAKELSRWTYEALDAQVRAARRNARIDEKHLSLFAAVSEAAGVIHEARFIDAVSRSLRRGEFLLLIAGDGIREGVGAITEFLDGHGSLHFTFGLVEMAIYRMPDDGLLVQPRVIAQSEIARRIVVEVRGEKAVISEPTENPSEDDDVASPELAASREFFTDFWTGFLKGLRLDDQSQSVPGPSKGTNLYFMMPAASKAWVSAYLAKSKGQAGVYFCAPRGAVGDQLYAALKERRAEIEAALGIQPVWEDEGDGPKWIIVRRPLGDVRTEPARSEMYAWLANMTNRFVTVFRPRVEKLMREMDVR